MRFSRPYHAAVDLQALILKRIQNPLTEDGDVARLALAWDKLEERKRILKGKPLVKAVEAKPKHKQPSVYSEPVMLGQ